MFYWIYDIPNWLLAILICTAFCLFGWTGMLLTRPIIRRRLGPQPASNDLVSYFLSAYGVFFGLMLGLIAVGTYENFAEVDSTTAKEAAALEALYQDAILYPEPFGPEMRQLIRDDCNFIIEKAWPEQKKGIATVGAQKILLSLEKRLLEFEPKTKSLDIFHADTLQEFNAYSELRTQRINSVTTGLPVTLWNVVIIGALLNLVLCWLFSIDRLDLHFILVGILAIFIGLVVFLIAAMDNPFRGEFCVSSEPFELLRDGLMKEVR